MKDSATEGANTKERILNASEKLFAERGFDGASLRDITTLANVNLSVVYYYFSSKEDLLRSVMERYFTPVFEQEKKLFNEALAETKGGKIPLRKLLEIYIIPRISGVPETAMQINAMIFSKSMVNQKKIFDSIFSATEEMRAIFEREFSRTLPNLGIAELRLRLLCINASMFGIQKFSPHVKKFFSKSIPDDKYLEMLFNGFESLLLTKPTI